MTRARRTGLLHKILGEDGSVLLEGAELLSKDHPVWGGKAPDIRYPDLLPVVE